MLDKLNYAFILKLVTADQEAGEEGGYSSSALRLATRWVAGGSI